MGMLLVAIFLAWVFTGAEKQPFDLARAIAATIWVIIDPLGLVGLWFLSVGIGIWQAYVTISDDGLQIYGHQFSMWSLRRMRRTKLAWSEVAGVQPFSVTNMYAPGGRQQEYIVYTSEGKFVFPEMLWPDAQQIAEQISQNTGKAIGDLSAIAEPAVGSRPSDRRTIRLMHGIGWFALAAGLIFLPLSVLAIVGGSPVGSMAPVWMMSAILIIAGISLRHFSMT